MDGVINVYKPLNITSFDVVRKIKKITNIKKIGHTGTLDPMACGVLPICIGKATKIVDYLMQDYKIYRADLELGKVTDTYDLEGTILEQNEVNVSGEDVKKVINKFIGEIEQIPPMYSALKMNGKRLYELARQGIEVERKGRNITIFDINIIEINLPLVKFDVKCSKGTYIRSLCYDIGKELGCGGTMAGLERLSTGFFTKENSIHLENLTEENIKDYLITIDNALQSYEKVLFGKKHEKLLMNGVEIKDKAILENIPDEALLRVYIEDKFIGLGTKNNFSFKMVKLLV
ncbi:MAG: tRNA pseudouridine(55) synthase TruB [Bacillota bacterium]|nr:tRNA pseudouridine(55) synthase TruB [Bacillota bacterium]